MCDFHTEPFTLAYMCQATKLLYNLFELFTPKSYTIVNKKKLHTVEH
ncbi:hypothetical protein KDA_00320 [Dictyobacter alpinus]|uniref:Uncharacterized protein n=1 Tax=Dictyobacter alpinus TaxID=2014873 RepID=A0A402AZP0_9CHLR|nr:hypothetical protein KDA_00320 [Dictyobacter alpinus]